MFFYKHEYGTCDDDYVAVKKWFMIPLADYKERLLRVDGILFACNEKQAERHK